MKTANFQQAWNWTIANGGFVYCLPGGEFLATTEVRFDLQLAEVQ